MGIEPTTSGLLDQRRSHSDNQASYSSTGMRYLQNQIQHKNQVMIMKSVFNIHPLSATFTKNYGELGHRTEKRFSRSQLTFYAEFDSVNLYQWKSPFDHVKNSSYQWNGLLAHFAYNKRSSII